MNFDVAFHKSKCLADVSIAIPSNIIAPKPRNYGGCKLYLEFRNSDLVEGKFSLKCKKLVNIYLLYKLLKIIGREIPKISVKLTWRTVKSKFIYYGYEIAIDGTGKWSLNSNIFEFSVGHAANKRYIYYSLVLNVKFVI